MEGTTDAELFQLAARLERAATGVDLLDANLTILAAGSGDLGGKRGVIRELVCFRGLARVDRGIVLLAYSTTIRLADKRSGRYAILTTVFSSIRMFSAYGR